MHVWESRPGDVETYRLGSGSKQERVIGVAAAIRELNLPARRVDCRYARAQVQIDFVVFIEFLRSEWVRLVGCGAGEKALRQVGPVARHRLIRAQHRDAAGVAFAAKHLGGCIARRTTSDDNDRRWYAGRQRS